MPTYDYACESCQHRFEAFQSISATPLRACPACGVEALRRLIGTGAGIIFRGSGFYETDYKRAASGKGTSESAKSDSSEMPKSDGSTKSPADSSSPASTANSTNTSSSTTSPAATTNSTPKPNS